MLYLCRVEGFYFMENKVLLGPSSVRHLLLLIALGVVLSGLAACGGDKKSRRLPLVRTPAPLESAQPVSPKDGVPSASPTSTADSLPPLALRIANGSVRPESLASTAIAQLPAGTYALTPGLSSVVIEIAKIPASPSASSAVPSAVQPARFVSRIEIVESAGGKTTIKATTDSIEPRYIPTLEEIKTAVSRLPLPTKLGISSQPDGTSSMEVIDEDQLRAIFTQATEPTPPEFFLEVSNSIPSDEKSLLLVEAAKDLFQEFVSKTKPNPLIDSNPGSGPVLVEDQLSFDHYLTANKKIRTEIFSPAQNLHVIAQDELVVSLSHTSRPENLSSVADAIETRIWLVFKKIDAK
jgi:hypothetical protein